VIFAAVSHALFWAFVTLFYSLATGLVLLQFSSRSSGSTTVPLINHHQRPPFSPTLVWSCPAVTFFRTGPEEFFSPRIPHTMLGWSCIFPFFFSSRTPPIGVCGNRGSASFFNWSGGDLSRRLPGCSWQPVTSAPLEPLNFLIFFCMLKNILPVPICFDSVSAGEFKVVYVPLLYFELVMLMVGLLGGLKPHPRCVCGAVVLALCSVSV